VGGALLLAGALCLLACGAAPKSARTVVPFQLVDHRVMVSVTINGEGPFHMVFDTGGSNVLDTAVAERLGLSRTAMGFAGGAGDGRTPMYQSQHIDMRIGAIARRDQTFMVLDLSPIARAFDFPHLDGIVGYELLQQFGVTIDFGAHEVVFHDLDTFTPEGTPVPFRLERRKPIITGSIAGIPTEMLVDTGDRSSFTLFTQFAHAHGLDRHFDARRVASGQGLGGPIPARMGRLPDVSLGPAPNPDVVARLPLTKTDYFARSPLGGSVGNGLLKSYVVSFDYRRRVMTLQLQQRRAYRFTPPRPAGAPG
jgi:predicted aspartyl protease